MPLERIEADGRWAGWEELSGEQRQRCGMGVCEGVDI